MNTIDTGGMSHDDFVSTIPSELGPAEELQIVPDPPKRDLSAGVFLLIVVGTLWAAALWHLVEWIRA